MIWNSCNFTSTYIELNSSLYFTVHDFALKSWGGTHLRVWEEASNMHLWNQTSVSCLTRKFVFSGRLVCLVYTNDHSSWLLIEAEDLNWFPPRPHDTNVNILCKRIKFGGFWCVQMRPFREKNLQFLNLSTGSVEVKLVFVALDDL